jgi:peptidoglycan hydrolase CwlO-like protein
MEGQVGKDLRQADEIPRTSSSPSSFMVFGLESLSSLMTTAFSTVKDRPSTTRSYALAAGSPPAARGSPARAQPQLSPRPSRLQDVNTDANATSWKQRYEDCTKEISALQRQIEALHLREMRETKPMMKLAAFDAANVGLTEHLSSLGKKYRALLRDLRAVRGENVELKKYMERQANTYKALRTNANETTRDLQRLRTKYQDMESLLATRTAELRDAQTYLAKTDTTSHADVQRMVEGLNAEIFQLSALVTDSISFTEAREYPSNSSIAYAAVERCIGSPAAALLLGTLHSDDPVWVQLSLQAAVTMFTGLIINAWDLRLSGTLNALLTNIHKSMFEHGEWSLQPYEENGN